MSRHGELGCFVARLELFVRVWRTRGVLKLSKIIIDHSPKVARFCSERWSPIIWQVIHMNLYLSLKKPVDKGCCRGRETRPRVFWGTRSENLLLRGTVPPSLADFAVDDTSAASAPPLPPPPPSAASVSYRLLYSSPIFISLLTSRSNGTLLVRSSTSSTVVRDAYPRLV